MKKLLLPLLLFCITAKAQTAGPTAPATATNVGTGFNWVISPTNVSCNTTAGSMSVFLQGTNFGFAIPGSATINGIVLQSAMYTSNSPHNDTIVQLLKNLVPTGQNKNMPGSIFAGQLTYGANTDLWGITWTPADVNNANFGFQFKIQNLSTVQNYLYFAGQFSITVYYSTVTGISTHETKVLDLVNAYSYNNQLIVKNNGDADLDQSLLSVTNILGQKIYSQKITVERSNTDIKILLPEHPKGIYILSIDKENMHYAKKLYID